MNGSKVRAAGVALASVVAAGLAASPASAGPRGTVGSVSSLAAGAKAGTVRGEVVNRSDHAVDAKVTVRIQRTGAAAKFVGKTAVLVPANVTRTFKVAVKLPGSLSRGN